MMIELASEQQRFSKVVVISLGENNGDMVNEVKSRGIFLLCLNSRHKFTTFKIIINTILCSRPRAIHIHSPYTLRYLLPVLPFFNTKIIYTRHGAYAFDSLLWKLIHMIGIPFISHLTFVSREGMHNFTESHYLWNKPYKIIRNGISIPEYTLRVPGNTIRFGIVGRIVKVKGHDFLLDAWEKLPFWIKQKAQLNIIGSGALEDKIKRRVANTGDNSVVLRGQIMDIERIYDSIDVLLIPSETEGLPMVLIEAMARCIPCIATDVGEIGSIVRDGQTGILIRYGEVATLASAIIKVACDPNWIIESGMIARQMIINNFSIKIIADEYEQFLKENIKP